MPVGRSKMDAKRDSESVNIEETLSRCSESFNNGGADQIPKIYDKLHSFHSKKDITSDSEILINSGLTLCGINPLSSAVRSLDKDQSAGKSVSKRFTEELQNSSNSGEIPVKRNCDQESLLPNSDCSEEYSNNYASVIKDTDSCETNCQQNISSNEYSSDINYGTDSVVKEDQSSNTPDNSNEMPAVEDSSSLDSRRTRRNNKRKREKEECCPVCGITVRLPELQSHYIQEVEKLTKIPKSLKKSRREESSISKTFVQVKRNRENRLSAKVARYAARARKDVHCPVCNLELSGTQEEDTNHVLLCLEQDEFAEEDIIIDDDENFEEYDFADQTRIRAISLIPGGYRSLHGQSTRNAVADEDEDVDVDVIDDNTVTYGEPQYTELDVIPNYTENGGDEELQLRKAVLLNSNAQPNVLESRKWSSHEDCEAEKTKKPTDVPDDSRSVRNSDISAAKNSPSDHVVSSLKEKIKDLEDQSKSVKCLICMESYTKPVVSTTCWHVHCEECWLMTMNKNLL
ncbi:E3 ubiquitin-protein ligase RNF220-like [Stegodyphus dumicola]|uniref:E3 ubiquitin-protein ligase RNF220-like n=1 Tax=Stegodyphus dumicola TaxID=202533 RepID=UPI0015B3223F|nr:E3 ubiquitin-protein ligase RNF220-like [Stegodyphus dumicola]